MYLLMPRQALYKLNEFSCDTFFHCFIVFQIIVGVGGKTGDRMNQSINPLDSPRILRVSWTEPTLQQQ